MHLRMAHVGLISIAVLVAAACSNKATPTFTATTDPSSVSSTPTKVVSPSPTASPTPDVQAIEDAATNALLTVNDFPTGWTGTPQSTDDDDSGPEAFRKCSDQTTTDHLAKVKSDNFADAEKASLSESLVVFGSAGEARAGLENLAPLTNCLIDAINSGAGNSGGTTFDGATSAAMSFPQVGDASQALQVTFQGHAAGLTIPAYIQSVWVIRGLTTFSLQTSHVGSPFDAEMLLALAQKAVAHVDAQPLLKGSAGTGGAASGATPIPSPTATPLAAVALGPSDILGGDATPDLPAGDAGKMTTILIGSYASLYGSTIVPIVIRNNTNGAVSHVEVSAGASDAAGKIVASGKSQGFHPSTLQPGAAAMGYVYFSSDVPPGADFSFTFQTSTPSTSAFAYADLHVDQANDLRTHIAGSVTNATGKTIDGPIDVAAYCFDNSSVLLGILHDFADGPDELAPGTTVTFDLPLGSQSCPHFLLGASGFYKSP